MRYFLLILAMCMTGLYSMAQCNASATLSMAPLNNNLLRIQLANTSTYQTGLAKYTIFSVNWGDATSNNVSAGNSFHSYSSPGKKAITMVLQTWDSTASGVILSCSDTLLDSIDVVYSPCASYFTSSSVGNIVTVSAINPAGTSGMSYSWNWGDGSSNGSGISASHNYLVGGIKTIVLTSTNGTCSYTCVLNVLVTSCSGAVANFTANTSGGLNASFVNTSSLVSQTTQSATWYYGDGSTGNGASTSHVYATAGNYVVCIVARWYDSLTTNLRCTDSICKTIAISTSNNQISGWILQDSTSTQQIDSPIYDVWLIDYDSTTGMLTAQDSIRVHGTYYLHTPYTFNNAPSGNYRVKAKLINGPTSGTTYVPTYHYSSLTWNAATTFNHYSGITSGKDIMLQKGIYSSGSGFISGNVSQGANKGSSGNGLEGMNIFLLDGSGKLVQCAVTDVNGDYSFSNLFPASYSIYPECMNYNTVPASVVITNGNAIQTSVRFTRSNSQMSITPIPTGTQNVINKYSCSIFPNPARDKVTIRWSANMNENADITITDMTGKKVYSNSVQTSINTILNLGGLQKGLYFIHIMSNKIQKTEKIQLQ